MTFLTWVFFKVMAIGGRLCINYFVAHMGAAEDVAKAARRPVFSFFFATLGRR
jgi:hypothetical protein